MRNVDEFIDLIPATKAKLVLRLRELLLSLVPGIQEKLSFNIPFYHYFGMFCYINPTKEGIDLGFCRGRDLAIEFPQLDMKKRAIVGTVLIRHEKDIDQLRIREIIIAAAIWNEEAKRLQLPMVSKKKKGNGKQ